jgi:DNA-binding MarR family transcriptional regulator
MSERQPRDLVDTVGLLFEAAGAVRRTIADDLESTASIPTLQFEVLIRLHRAPESTMRMNQMAELVSLPQSSFSRLVDRMEENGFLLRSVDPTNRRATLIETTPSGQARLEAGLSQYLDSANAHVVSYLTDRELDQLERIARKLRDANS